MALHDQIELWWFVPIGVAVTIGTYLYHYLVVNRTYMGIPSPSFARFSNWWLFKHAQDSKFLDTVDELHKKNGQLVRLGPNYVSVASDEAIPQILGHGNGLLKSDFYNAFLVGEPNIFSTRSRPVHARKRKAMSNVFSAASIHQFEPYVQSHIREFIGKLDNFAYAGEKGPAFAGQTFDILPWFHYLTFDVISDLAFGYPLQMIRNSSDMAEARLTPDSKPIYVPAIGLIDSRAKVNASVGYLPSVIPYMKYLPVRMLRESVESGKKLFAIATARVGDRLDNPPEEGRKDVLQKLIDAKDENGNPLGRGEITGEAIAQLVAGSDTTSNSLASLLYYAATTPGVLEKLRAELDAAVPEDMEIPTHDIVANLPYLNNVIKETLRRHSLLGLGLPRVVPPESAGVTILGHYFPPGSVLSVPTYTLHHSTEIWGPDAHEFRPDRWDNVTPRQKAVFMPFSVGSRACIGRNLAEMELKLITATWARRYEVEVRQKGISFRQGFLRKPDQVVVELRRR